MQLMLIVSVFLLGSALGLPKIQPVINDFPRKYDFLISSCLYESWDFGLGMDENIKNALACVGCFDQIEDIMSEEGLPKAVTCAHQYLPAEIEACSKELSNIQAGNPELGEAVSECFKKWTFGASATYCDSISTSGDPIDKLTDGSICMLEGLKNNTMFINYVHTLDTNDNRAGRKVQKTMKEGSPVVNFARRELFPLASCQSANPDDEERMEACNQCFSAVTNENKDTEGPKCVNEYLLPYYQDCIEDVESDNKQEIGKCFGRGWVKHVVKFCNPDPVEANPETLMTTMECGQEYVINWVEENSRPEMAKKIIKFLTFDDECDEDEDESEEDE